MLGIPKDLIREYPAIDDDCIELCKAINLYKPNIFTTESCCGHGKTPYHIWFKVMNLEFLPHILYWMNGCHTGYYGWRVMVKTDCGKQYPTFLIEGPIQGSINSPINRPIDAYGQAAYIALCIRQDFFETRFEQNPIIIKWLIRLFDQFMTRTKPWKT